MQMDLSRINYKLSLLFVIYYSDKVSSTFLLVKYSLMIINELR